MKSVRVRRSKQVPLLVAIVGGSGSGKSRLAAQLSKLCASKALCLSQDDFYRDRSHLTPAQRERVNYDHPRSVDWLALERVLKDLRAGRVASVPRYNFQTHSREPRTIRLRTRPIIFVEGLWLLRRTKMRQEFGLKLYLDCPARTRLARRLARDVRARARTAASVRRQFNRVVEPMHRRFVAPQLRRADIVWPGNWGKHEVRRLAKLLQAS